MTVVERSELQAKIAKLGSIIRRLREARGWSQGDLSQRSGLYRSHISHLESGNRVNVSMWVVWQIADALGVSVDDLLVQAGIYEPASRADIPAPEIMRLARTLSLLESLSPEGRALFDDLADVLEEIRQLDQPAQAQARADLNQQVITTRKQVSDLAHRVREYYALLPPQKYYGRDLTVEELAQTMDEIKAVVARKMSFLDYIESEAARYPEEEPDQARRIAYSKAEPFIPDSPEKRKVAAMVGVSS